MCRDLTILVENVIPTTDLSLACARPNIEILAYSPRRNGYKPWWHPLGDAASESFNMKGKLL